MSTVVSVRLEADEIARLDRLAANEGITRSDVIRGLIAGLPHRSYTWVAHYPDFSSVVPFSNEVDALRHAVDHDMKVIRVPYGIPIEGAVRAEFDEARQR